MTSNAFNDAQAGNGNWDLFRLSRGKAAVDISPNTLRSYHRNGLPFYRSGKAVFVSKAELAAFIRQRATRQEAKRP